MKFSDFFFFTHKEIPKEAKVPSHILMLRTGMIKQFASGIYSFLPLGFRIIRKIEKIVREEMEKIGGQELLLPFVQPSGPWKKSGRWENYGEELVKFKDRKGQEFLLGPTHEELITQLAKEGLDTYKKLPLLLYQIQIKFRDEPRPRGGVIRAREFIMKDAYSFSRTREELFEVYQRVEEAYKHIFTRCGLSYWLVEAVSGPIGGGLSHEFITPCPTGEDRVVVCEKCEYKAKWELAEGVIPSLDEGEEEREKREIHTPGVKTVTELVEFLNVSPRRILKSLFYLGKEKMVMALVRGDHEVNEEKLRKVVGEDGLRLASPQEVKEKLGLEVGFAGPVGIKKVFLVADKEVLKEKNLVAGANKKEYHLLNVNPERDFYPQLVADVRYITSEDRCSCCGGRLKIERGIEIGHLFQLGEKYSRSLEATFLDEEGRKKYFVMGCYGIGVSRLPAVIIEQNRDEEGILWPREVAPFEAVVISIGEGSFQPAGRIYERLKEGGIEVAWDDREISGGEKFKDADLMGLPLKLIIGRRFFQEGLVEIKERKTGHIEKVKEEDILERVRKILNRKEKNA